MNDDDLRDDHSNEEEELEGELGDASLDELAEEEELDTDEPFDETDPL